MPADEARGVACVKSILMATDLSARSDRALERAVNLAQAHGAQLTIVHVIDSHLPASLADGQEATARQSIKEQIAELAPQDRSRIAISVAFGRSHVEILATSEKVDADLIVVGAHRADAFMDLFRGTTAERVIRAARVPVLLVKDPMTKPYQRVMVGVDFSVYSKQATGFAESFVPQGVFHLVHAYDVPFSGFFYGQKKQSETRKRDQMGFQKKIEGEMAAFLADLKAKPPKYHTVLKEGSAQQVILRQIEHIKPDLLVIGTHGLTGIAHAFLGSVAEDMLREPPCDVLAVKA